MLRAWLALAILPFGMARGAGPNYSAAGIVNTANYTAGPFAPNSIISIFGSGMARSAQALTLAPGATQLPIELNYVRVYVNDMAAALFYVSDGQINFLMPANLQPQTVTIRVVTEGISGPQISATLGAAAPALFPLTGGYAIATHADGTLLTSDSPAHPGDTIVIYLTGLGYTNPNPGPAEIQQDARQIVQMGTLQVVLNGGGVDPIYVKYAGLTPGSAGLYQINLVLPGNTSTDPEIRVSVAGQSSPAGLKLPVH